MTEQQFRVKPLALNLRRDPIVRPDNIIVALPHGQLLTKLGVAGDPQWWRVSTFWQQNRLEGFVHSSYLVPAATFVHEYFKVNALGLNLRTEPAVRPNNILAILPQGQLVTKVAATTPPWWRISTVLQQNRLEGFVHSGYLLPLSEYQEPPPERGIPAVHLALNNPYSRRNSQSSMAHPLSEPGQPTRNGTTPAMKAAELTGIVTWLNAEQSLRYKPGRGKTFCNIYAYDYCYLANVYLPRVWWTQTAIRDLAAGGSVTPQYGVTVREMTANLLLDWLKDFGPDFGWVRIFDLTELQLAANQGEVALICAQRRELNQPGHINLAVPETATHQAFRSGVRVIAPLQSQAGAVNFRYSTPVWWTQSIYREFGFWRHW